MCVPVHLSMGLFGYAYVCVCTYVCTHMCFHESVNELSCPYADCYAYVSVCPCICESVCLNVHCRIVTGYSNTKSFPNGLVALDDPIPQR